MKNETFPMFFQRLFEGQLLSPNVHVANIRERFQYCILVLGQSPLDRSTRVTITLLSQWQGVHNNSAKTIKQPSDCCVWCTSTTRPPRMTIYTYRPDKIALGVGVLEEAVKYKRIGKSLKK